MRRYRFPILSILVLVWLSLAAFAAEPIRDLRPTVILISVDGFRADYLERFDTPNLHQIMERGVHAKYMIPSFPTKTFPNHYTMVTGLYPAHHGIVANTMYDPDLKLKFTIKDPAAQRDRRWWGGEPIWVTAEKQGLRTAPLMWPGSLAERPGARPTYTQDYDGGSSSLDRVEKLISLLDVSAKDRPQFLTLYIDDVDEAGHNSGPNSVATSAAVQQADAAIGHLVKALNERGIDDQVNIIVVSDHGMEELSPKKIVFLDNFVALANVDVIDGSPLVTLRPKDSNVEALYQQLKRVPHAKAYLAGNAPERWHYAGSSRITPVFLLADEKWTITTKEWAQGHRLGRGNHGFDNRSKQMRAIFMAAGPAFEQGTIKPFANIHIYSLIAHLLNIVPAQTDGKLDVFNGVLRRSTQTEPSRKQLAPWQKEWDEVALNQ